MNGRVSLVCGEPQVSSKKCSQPRRTVVFYAVRGQIDVCRIGLWWHRSAPPGFERGLEQLTGSVWVAVHEPRRHLLLHVGDASKKKGGALHTRLLPNRTP